MDLKYCCLCVVCNIFFVVLQLFSCQVLEGEATRRSRTRRKEGKACLCLVCSNFFFNDPVYLQSLQANPSCSNLQWEKEREREKKKRKKERERERERERTSSYRTKEIKENLFFFFLSNSLQPHAISKLFSTTQVLHELPPRFLLKYLLGGERNNVCNFDPLFFPMMEKYQLSHAMILCQKVATNNQ